jgi:hypothetical protein
VAALIVNRMFDVFKVTFFAEFLMDMLYHKVLIAEIELIREKLRSIVIIDVKPFFIFRVFLIRSLFLGLFVFI